MDSAKTASLELQDKCAKQASAEFKTFEDRELAAFTDHYNLNLNKCFILVEYMDTVHGVRYEWLNDAYEGKVYGQYEFKADKVKKYWEVPPVVCKVTPPSGDGKICSSSDEFDALVKQYME